VTIADRTGSDYRTGGKGLLGESRQSRCENNSNAPNFTPQNVKKMKALRVNAQIELLVHKKPRNRGVGWGKNQHSTQA
jgi:hypothetical protein